MFSPHQRIFLQSAHQVQRTIPTLRPQSRQMSIAFGETPKPSEPKQSSLLSRIQVGAKAGWQNIRANFKRTAMAGVISVLVGLIPPMHFTLLTFPIVLALFGGFDFMVGFVRGIRNPEG